MKDIVAIVLAAGRGTRMKSQIPKVLHEIFGKSIISYVLDCLNNSGVTGIITVVGYGSELLKKAASGTRIIVQKKLLGSGDAVRTAKKILGKYPGDVLVIYGDNPLIQGETIKKLIEKHKSSGAKATLLTAELKDPTGYGRIVRDDSGKMVKIVEEEKARIYEEVISEVNVGAYCFNAIDLFEALDEVKPDNAKSEFFLTDTIAILHRGGKLIESVKMEDVREMIGINSRRDLAEATNRLKSKILEEIMDSGVTVEDPLTTTIYPGAKIGKDTIIHPNTFIGPDVEIGRRCHVGPFATLRANVSIGDEVLIGNFVELVRTSVGDSTRIKHHTYLGDTIVGKNANIGAGMITANYDGKSKNKTVIGDNAFIGVGAILVAPVKIGQGAMVGAGCVVLKNRNVPKRATVVGVPARILKKEKKGKKDEERATDLQRKF